MIRIECRHLCNDARSWHGGSGKVNGAVSHTGQEAIKEWTSISFNRPDERKGDAIWRCMKGHCNEESIWRELPIPCPSSCPRSFISRTSGLIASAETANYATLKGKFEKHLIPCTNIIEERARLSCVQQPSEPVEVFITDLHKLAETGAYGGSSATTNSPQGVLDHCSLQDQETGPQKEQPWRNNDIVSVASGVNTHRKAKTQSTVGGVDESTVSSHGQNTQNI